MTDEKNSDEKFPDDGKAKRHWLFTSYKDSVAFGNLVRGYAYQREKCPKTGTLHWQGYMELSRPVRLKQAQRECGDDVAHMEARRWPRDKAITYCTKERTRVDGPWVSGSCEKQQGQGRRSDLHATVDTLKEKGIQAVVDEHPVEYVKYFKGLERLEQKLQPAVPKWNPPHVTVLVGETDMGKTRWAFENYPDLYLVEAPKKGQNLWWDGYTDQKTILIDEFRGWIDFSKLLRILDGYPMRLDVKFGHAQKRWNHVIITSNRTYKEWYHGKTDADWAALKRRLTCYLEFSKAVTVVTL